MKNYIYVTKLDSEHIWHFKNTDYKFFMRIKCGWVRVNGIEYNFRILSVLIKWE